MGVFLSMQYPSALINETATPLYDVQSQAAFNADTSFLVLILSMNFLLIALMDDEMAVMFAITDRLQCEFKCEGRVNNRMR